VTKNGVFYQCCGSGSAWIRIRYDRRDPDPGWQKSGSAVTKNAGTAYALKPERIDLFFTIVFYPDSDGYALIRPSFIAMKMRKLKV
jgi:hypothetical protein